MRFTRVVNVMMSRVMREGVKFKLSPTQMHTILGSTDDSSPEQLRELYLARVREIHPDTRSDDAVTTIAAIRKMSCYLFSLKLSLMS